MFGSSCPKTDKAHMPRHIGEEVWGRCGQKDPTLPSKRHIAHGSLLKTIANGSYTRPHKYHLLPFFSQHSVLRPAPLTD